METITLSNLQDKIRDHGDVVKNEEVNNHVHSSYSFSPYSPSGAAYHAWMAGLNAVGIMDHDSISGADEILEACKILKIGSTVGFEVRVNMNGTSVQGRKLNNPDSTNIGYIAMHGVPNSSFDKVKKFLEPINIQRNLRNRVEVDKLNQLMSAFPIEQIDFDKDVYGISNASIGGSITERHILYALSTKITNKYGKGLDCVTFLKNEMKLDLSAKIEEILLDTNNPHYLYDLLGVLKSNFLPKFFVQPTDTECVNVQVAVDFANSIGAIPCYAYLGDITSSATGDKKAEKFEDDFLDELLIELKRIGFKAITYMPPRNSKTQLKRVQKLCSELGFMEISGVDINSSRQVFNCPEVLDPDFSHLIESTWALIAHEKLASRDIKYSLFDPKNELISLPLSGRLSCYSKIGKILDPSNPELTDEIVEIINNKKVK